jgi:hypothetical protein
MISGLNRSRMRLWRFFVLTVAVSALFAGNGFAGLAFGNCGTAHAALKPELPVAPPGCCCCEKGRAGGQDMPCSDLKADCGSDSAAQFVVSISNNESPILDSSPAFALSPLLALPKANGPITASGNKFIYLANLNLLC